MNKESSKFAGKTVKIKAGATHPQVPNFAGSDYEVEEYWDKLTGKSWMDSDGNPACIFYAIRAAENHLPMDDNVVYGKIGCFGHLVHVSEIVG